MGLNLPENKASHKELYRKHLAYISLGDRKSCGGRLENCCWYTHFFLRCPNITTVIHIGFYAKVNNEFYILSRWLILYINFISIKQGNSTFPTKDTYSVFWITRAHRDRGLPFFPLRPCSLQRLEGPIHGGRKSDILYIRYLRYDS